MKLRISAVLALLFTAVAGINHAADLTLRFGTPFVTNSNLHKAMEKFAEVVAKESGGSIKVQVYADSQIGDIQQLIAGMQLGTVDMGLSRGRQRWTTQGLRAAQCFLSSLLVQEQARRGRRAQWPHIPGAVRTMRAVGRRAYFCRRRRPQPARHRDNQGADPQPEDLNGMRLRIPPIPIFRETFEAVGVKVVPLGLNEVYMALSRGQVDGQDTAST